MLITEVEYSRLVSLGDFSNLRFSAKASVAPEDCLEDVTASLKRFVVTSIAQAVRDVADGDVDSEITRLASEELTRSDGG